MNRQTYESLTSQEKACLRLVAKERDSGEIARELSLSAGTVNNYIKNARAKLGGVTRFAAARDLRSYEALVLSRDLPPKEVGDRIDGPHPAADRHPAGHIQFREERADFFQISDGEGGSDVERSSSSTVRALRTMALIAVLMVAFAVFMSLAYPAAEGAQHLANLLVEPHLD